MATEIRLSKIDKIKYGFFRRNMDSVDAIYGSGWLENYGKRLRPAVDLRNEYEYYYYTLSDYETISSTVASSSLNVDPRVGYHQSFLFSHIPRWESFSSF